MESIAAWKDRFKAAGYIATDEDIRAIRAAVALEKPLLIEGPPGVGKTAVAHALARIYKQDLLRVQCYEGIDSAQLLYEYNYPKQLLMISLIKEKIHETIAGKNFEQAIDFLDKENAFWGEKFLIKRPVMQALHSENGQKRVLLIDEVDKTEKDAEAFLLEVLSEYSLSIPEFGTVKAEVKPIVVLTSNRNREITEALRRRCIYLYIDYPDSEMERSILRMHVPEADASYLGRVVEVVQRIRALPLKHLPAVSATLECLKLLIAASGDARDLLHALAKHPEDCKTIVDSNILGL